ncbi:MAG: autotransporter outer membrane beta-barrel domain-containing protein [Sphingomonadales bacterium]|nr:MAG: autotransporter outer membrane beta-barrel domain-containing protein [Sphingomonadales bacterium]
MFGFDSPYEGLLMDFVNTGTIRSTGEGESFYGGRPSVIGMQDYSVGTNRIRVVNDGTMEATGRGAYVLQLIGAQYELVNSKVIRATGIGSSAVGIGSAKPGSKSTFVNSGTVSANGGEWVDGRAFGASIATTVGMGGYQTAFDLTNAAGGTIEATGTGSVAVYARGQVDGENQFAITNRGTIRGASDTVLPARALPNFEIDGGVLAGAIHTFNTIDVIRNEGGLIQGNIDLGAFNDEVHNSGTINGDVRLGDGSDSYVIAQGGTLTGTADGGTGFDTIHVDLTGDAAKKINASQFTDFEALAKQDGTSGTGKVSAFGTFGAPSMLLGSGFVLHVDEGDTVASGNGSTGTTFVGDDGEQQINNAGTIAGGLVMGAGKDTVTNSGTIGFNVSMGEGDDIVTNSGTIKGNLNLGGGNDRYEALGGLVTGTIDGGAGTDDTFVFRMDGDDGSIPGGFVNFESFGAYGPGTLTLALNEDYNTIELLERANLTLEDGTGKVGLIKGDDTAQVVTINDADFDGSISLGGGDDTLAISLDGTLTGELDGGAGTDALNLNLTGDSTINDLYNFEIVNAAGASSLTLQGTLGAGQQINFDGSDNHFIVDTGAVFEGTANGGAGIDTFETISAGANSRTIVAGQLNSFERLIARGRGALELRGEAYSFDSVEAEGDLTIGDGASLASGSGIQFNDSDNKLTLEGTGAVNSPVNGGDGTDTLAFTLAQGQIRNLSSAGNVTGFEQLAAEGAGMLNIDQNTDGYRQLLLGEDASPSLASVDGGHATIAEGVTFSGDVAGNDGANSLTLKAGATLDGEVYMNGGNDVVSNAGTIDGNLDLGAGDDRYIARSGGVVTGNIDGGAGNNTFIFNLDGGFGSIPGSVLNFKSFGAYGPGTLNVNLDAGQAYQNLELIEGANLVLSGTNGSVGNVIGDDSAQSVTIDGALTGGVSLGGGDDSLTMQLSGLLEGALDGGAGTDTLNLNLTGASSINGMYGFEIANIAGASPLTLTGDLGAGQQVNFTGDIDNELIIGAGVKFEGTVNGGAGRDLLRVQSGAADSRTVVASQIIAFEDLVSEGEGTLALTGGDYSFDTVAVKGGNFELGENTHLTASGVTFDDADNRFTLRSGATVAGAVAGGEGDDTLALIQNAGATRLLSSLQQSGFEQLEASGAGELRIDEDATFTGGVFLNNGTVNVLAGTELTANVTGGAGADTLIVGGLIDGDVDLGDGNDTLTLTGLNGISGAVTGGAGTDRLRFNTSGTYAAPTEFDGSNYNSFEAFDVAGGVVSIAGNSSWDNVSVTGGRLIGQAGSVITSSSAIQVTHGATFGSAGIVNADINVAGTLSPGASPGTMTVNGNVNFAAGSNLLIEVSPTISDLLNISGKLTIAAGAAIDITGVLQGTPGNTLDLVVAQGGITGRFTTINKSADVFGFVVQNGNKLQIQSEFLNDDAYPTNVQASVDYANEVLRSGYGVQAFTAGLPVLVDAQGVVNQAAFRQLTPEAYGSALQLGVENSLSLVDGAHNAKAAMAGRSGLYSFGQFLTGSADVNATGGNTGASRSHLTRTGFFGGIAYGFGEDAQVGVFFGGLDSGQKIGGLGAKTDADALAGGIFADATLGGFGVHGLLAFNGGKAKTYRQLAVTDSEASAKYDLNSWAVDLGVDYQVKLGSWSIAPKLGVTYVHTSRGAAVEQGAGDFGLTIDKGSKDILFGEAAVNVSGTFQTGGIGITPYAQLGVRQMLSDGDVLVSGHFTGADGAIVVNGIEREKTAVRVAVGLGLDLTDSVRVQAGYAGEFAGTKRNSVMGGLTVRF